MLPLVKSEKRLRLERQRAIHVQRPLPLVSERQPSRARAGNWNRHRHSSLVPIQRCQLQSVHHPPAAAEDLSLHGAEVRVFGRGAERNQLGNGPLPAPDFDLFASLQTALNLPEAVTQVSNGCRFHNVTYLSITSDAHQSR